MKLVYEYEYNDKKEKIVKKLNESNKYEKIFYDYESSKNFYNLSHSNKTIYYSKYFKLWVIVIKKWNRKGKLRTFEIYKSYEEPIEISKLNNS